MTFCADATWCIWIGEFPYLSTGYVKMCVMYMHVVHSFLKLSTAAQLVNFQFEHMQKYNVTAAKCP